MGMEQLEPFKWDVVERQPSTIVHMLVEWLEAHQHYDFNNANFSVRRHFGIIAIVACIAAGLLLLASVVFNTILVVNIIRFRHLRISRIFLLQINVSLCDILRTCVLMPLTLVSIVSKDWVLGAELCHILPMMQQMVPNICNLNFLILAYEHYRGVRHAVTGVGQGWRRAPVAAFVIGIWTLGMISMLPFGQFSQFIDLADILSDKLHGVGLCVVAQNPRSFEIFRLIAIAGFVVPFVVSLYLYFRALTDERGMHMYEDKKEENETHGSTMPTSVADDENDDTQLRFNSSDDGTSLKDIRLKLAEASNVQKQQQKSGPGGRDVLLSLPSSPPKNVQHMHTPINPSFIQQNTMKDFLARTRSKSVNVEAIAAASSSLLSPPSNGLLTVGSAPHTIRSKSNNEISSTTAAGSNSSAQHTSRQAAPLDARANGSPDASPSARAQRSPSSNNGNTVTKRHGRSSSHTPNASPSTNAGSRRSSRNVSPRSSSPKLRVSTNNPRKSSHRHHDRSSNATTNEKYRKGSLSARMQPVSNNNKTHDERQRRLTSACTASYGTCGASQPQRLLPPPRANTRRHTKISENAGVHGGANPPSFDYCEKQYGPFNGNDDEDYAGDSISQLNEDDCQEQNFVPPLPITSTLRSYMRITLVHGFAQIPLNILVMVTALMAHHRLTTSDSNVVNSLTNNFASSTIGPSTYSTVMTTAPSFIFRGSGKHGSVHSTTTPRTGGELWLLISAPAASLVGSTSGANVVEALFLLLFLLTMFSAIVGPWIVLRTVARQQPQLVCYGYWLICFANKLAQLRRPSQQGAATTTLGGKQSKSNGNTTIPMENRRKMTQIRLIS